MPIRALFGAGRSAILPQTGEVQVAAPRLGGVSPEVILRGDPQIAAASSTHFLATQGEWLCTAYCLPLKNSIQEQTEAIYRRLFVDSAGMELVRVWNFLPRINDEDQGRETYQSFCMGRHEAYRQQFGEQAQAAYCAASAVGVEDDYITIYALATRGAVKHIENPLQIPAYEYPERYGPSPPSFSRATVVGGAHPALYISGTSAVRDSESVGSSLKEQLAITSENLDRIIAESLRQSNLSRAQLGEGQCRVYLRHPEDVPAVNAWLSQHPWCSPEQTSLIRADICRRELVAEIELSWPPALA